MLAILWGASRKEHMLCTQCNTRYETNTGGARTARLLLWVLLLVLLFLLFSQWFVKRL